MSNSANCSREVVKSTVFLLTKPPNSERAKLCIQLVNRSKKAVLYLAGDGIFNLLDPYVKALPPCDVYACKEDVDARGVQPGGAVILLVEFYEQLVKDAMVQSDKVYVF